MAHVRWTPLLTGLLLVVGNLAAPVLAQPRIDPGTTPREPRVIDRNPVTDPATGRDPVLDIEIPLDPTLPSSGQQDLTLPSATGGGLMIVGNWEGQLLTQSPVLTELASINGLLPEPAFLFDLPSAAGGANNSASNTVTTTNTTPGDNSDPGIIFDPGELDPDDAPEETPEPAGPDPEGEPSSDSSPGSSSDASDVALGQTTDSDTAAGSGTTASSANTELPDCQPQSNPVADPDEAEAAYAALSACYQQALNAARSQQDLALEAQTLNNLAIAQFVQGNYTDALALHQQQLEQAQAIGDEVQAGIARTGIGNCYAALGDYKTAIAQYTQALPQIRVDAAPQWRSLTLRNLGVAYYAQREFDTARQYHRQSLQLSSQIGDRYGVMKALGNLANLLALTEDFDTATTYYQQALSLAQELNNRLTEAQLLLGLGTAYAYQQNYADAVGYYEQSLEKARSIGARLGEGIALTNLGEALSRLNQLPAAERHLYDGVKLWESLRAGLGTNDDFKVSLFETQRAAYNNLQEVLIKQNKTNAALVASERGRARAFVELLARGGADAGAQTMPDLAALQGVASANQITLVEYAVIRDQITPLPHGASPQSRNKSSDDAAGMLYIWVIQPTGEVHFRQVDLTEQLAGLTTLVGESRRRLRSGDRGFATGLSDGPLQPGDLVRRQGDPPSWLPYEVVAVDVAAGTVTVSHPDIVLPEPTLPLSEFSRVEPANPWTQRSQPLRQLHTLLIEPIADLLPTDPNEPIVFVPQDQLFLVPFPALQASADDYLIDHHTILTAPTIQAVSATASTGNWQNPLIVGNPSPMPQALAALPYAETEALRIAEMLGTSPLVKAAATESTIKQHLAQADLIHLATHGFFNASDPLQGSLALSASGQQDGFLTAKEILDLPLSARLVVLSACDTGRGQITGDGVIGLSRAFLAAGADQVLVSLWQVPDDATGELMVSFYQQLEQGQSEARALRQAMLSTREAYPHPYAWAAFTLIGNAR
ncbi:MAG: CHAT domain-containing tetratricopeptide repeat protein [Cyanobacteria bacterium P01_D01_bin.14]